MALKGDGRLGDMLDYLTAEEEIVGRHRVGSFDVVTTTERVICLRKFPPVFVEVNYNDINNLEHHTNIMWNELLNALIFTVLGGFILLNNSNGGLVSPVNDLMQRNLPEVNNIIRAELLLPLLMWLFVLLGLYHLVQFIPSTRGYFRISRKERAPVVIPTGMSPQLRMLIKEIEELMRKKSEPRAPAPAAAKPVSAVAEDPIPAALKVKETLKAKLKELSENKVILISSKSEGHSLVVASVLDIFVNQKEMGGVYLSITRPYEFISGTIKAAGVAPTDIFFIDCISLMAGKTPHEKIDNVVFVENPSSLEEVSMYLDRMLAKVKSKKKFLFLDSLSSLLIYNTDKSVKEFTHFLINKIRLENIAGVILSIEKKEAEDLVKTLTPMCDAEIRF